MIELPIAVRIGPLNLNLVLGKVVIVERSARKVESFWWKKPLPIDTSISWPCISKVNFGGERTSFGHS
jgi:hypothetical protein